MTWQHQSSPKNLNAMQWKFKISWMHLADEGIVKVERNRGALIIDLFAQYLYETCTYGELQWTMKGSCGSHSPTFPPKLHCWTTTIILRSKDRRNVLQSWSMWPGMPPWHLKEAFHESQNNSQPSSGLQIFCHETHCNDAQFFGKLETEAVHNRQIIIETKNHRQLQQGPFIVSISRLNNVL